jgi:hypothetical protein
MRMIGERLDCHPDCGADTCCGACVILSDELVDRSEVIESNAAPDDLHMELGFFRLRLRQLVIGAE